MEICRHIGGIMKGTYKAKVAKEVVKESYTKYPGEIIATKRTTGARGIHF